MFALAVGIGLATIGFTLREAMLHGQLPFVNGDRFVRLVLHSDAEDNVQLDLEAYHAVRDTSRSFVHLGAVGDGEYAIEGEDGTAIRVGLVTPRSFQFLPAVPLIGRALTPQDGAPGAEPVVLVRAGDRARAAGVYGPLPDQTRMVHVAIRTTGNPHTTAGPLRKAVAGIDPKADVRSIRLLEDVGREQGSFLVGMAWAMTALGAMTLLLSVVSVYALLSFIVTRRTREIGVRVALGARRSQVFATVTGSAFALPGAGVAIGTIGGVMLAGADA